MSPHLIHSVVHFNVCHALKEHMPELLWAIDLDIEHNGIKFRPDIVGIKDDKYDVVIEISNSTFRTDSSTKKSLYLELGVKHYIIFDCNKSKVYKYELKNDDSYWESEYFDFINESLFIFE